jgi:hypothetical protein
MSWGYMQRVTKELIISQRLLIGFSLMHNSLYFGIESDKRRKQFNANTLH